MEGHGYSYATPYPPLPYAGGDYADLADGVGEYYGPGPLNDELGRSRSKQRTFKIKDNRSRGSSQTKSGSQSRSASRTRSGSRSETRQKEFTYREPSFLDAFRVLYLTPSSNRNPSKYLATQKQQNRVHEILKSDRFGSKRWYFYPRQKLRSDPAESEVAGSRDNCDQRVKVDGDFFRKYKRSKKIDQDAPIAKLKRWELILYKKLGFIQAV